jgi:hypothetical protein
LIADQPSTRDGHGLHAKLARGSPRNTGQKGINSTLGHPRVAGIRDFDEGRWVDAGWTLGGRWVDAGWTLGGRWVDAGWALGGRWVGAGWALGGRWVGAGWALGGRWVGAGWTLGGRAPSALQGIQTSTKRSNPSVPMKHHTDRLNTPATSTAPSQNRRHPAPNAQRRGPHRQPKSPLCSTWNIAERL